MRVALIAVLGLVVGCGDDTVNVSTSDENFCSQIAEVICHNMYQCCTEAEIEGRLDVTEPRTELQCREDIEVRCDRGAADVRDSLKAGRATFDPNRLNDCLNAILAPTDVCAEVVTETPWKLACKDSPWVGTVATGGTCFFNIDCAGGVDSFCGPDQKCKAKPTAGFPCGSGCASDFYCAPNATCAAKVALGGPCPTFNACQTDLYCDQNGTPFIVTDDVCAAKGGGGVACNTDNGCISNDCVPGQCQGQSASFTCFSDLDCDGHCGDDGSFCDADSDCGFGTCQVSGATCSEFSPCQMTTPYDSTNICHYTVQCLPGDCIGDPVCTAQTLIADYCSSVSFVPSP